MTHRSSTPRDLVRLWVDAFNRADAVNHQVAESPVKGRNAIREMFAADFASAKMACLVENL